MKALCTPAVGRLSQPTRDPLVGRRAWPVCGGEMVWAALSEGASGSQRRDARRETLHLKPVCSSVACANCQDPRDDASLSRQTAVSFRPGAECDVGVSEARLCRCAADETMTAPNCNKKAAVWEEKLEGAEPP